MNFTFLSPGAGLCAVKLWASGRYGFSLPKKVEIQTPAGELHTFVYHNRKVRVTSELSNRMIVKIAIAQYLAGASRPAEPGVDAAVEIDHDTPPFEGELTPVRSAAPRAPLRVRPGKGHTRTRRAELCDPA